MKKKKQVIKKATSMQDKNTRPASGARSSPLRGTSIIFIAI